MNTLKNTRLKVFILAALALMLSVPAVAADWPTRLHDARRSGVTTEQLASTPASLWDYTDPHGAKTAWTQSPAQQDFWQGYVNIGARQDFDRCMDVAAVGNYVYFGSSGSSTVKCLNATTGAEVWTFFTGAPVRLAPFVDSGNVYFGSDDGYVYCVNASTGVEVWSYRPGPSDAKVWGNQNMVSTWPVRGGVVVADGYAYYAAGLWPEEGMYVGRVDASTGASGYKVTASHPHQGYLLRAGNYLYAPSGKTFPSSYAAKNGKLNGDYTGYSVRTGGSWGLITADESDYWWGPWYWSDPGDWTTRNSATNPGSNYDVYDYAITFMAEDGTYIYYVTDDGRIVKANSSAFTEVWSKNFSYPYALIKAGDHLYAGGDGTLAAFADSNGSRDWTANVTGKVYGLAAANGKLFASTDAGKIYAYGVSVSLPDPATNLDPADSATGVSTGAVLSWTAGNGATSHDVYFGTASPPSFIQNQAGTTYDPPGAMATDTTHYWRIDEKNAQGTTAGTEWSFTTGSGADDYATGETTTDGTVSGSYSDTFASDNTYEAITEGESGGKPANRYSLLEHRWTFTVTGGESVSFEVEAYQTSSSDGDNFIFAYSTNGTNYTNMLTVSKTSDNDTAQTYPLPPSTSGTVYVRVVDTDHTGGNRSLDTIYVDHMVIKCGGASQDPPGPATNPNPSNGAAGVDVDADLSWTAGAGTTSHDVYFGTASPPPFIQNQGGATYNPGTMAESTTYNWRIDEVNGNGTTTGTEWSFTTGGGACTPTDMHIEAVVCAEISCGGPNRNGQATVTIYDDCGNPVTDALVDGTFTGDYSESFYDVPTDGNGQAVFTTAACAKRPTFTFTVTDVTDTLPYDSNDDVTDNCSG